MKKIIIVTFLVLFANVSVCLAQTEIKIVTNENYIEIGEELEVNIVLNDVASFTLEIYWNNTKLEYVIGPENSNKVNDKVLYTWVSETGKNINEINVGKFIFKGIEEGKANLLVKGEFYNSDGEKIEIENKNIVLQIGKEEESNASDDDASLKVLRINHEGISPDFNKDIKEYYFIADDTINELDVTAIPENEEANVTITGNNNFNIGANVINIEVQSKDKTKSEMYKIYVTKTKNVEMANANLENLAIRQASITPPFDFNVTKYYIEVANDIEKLDILAIPQNQEAIVKIVGNDDINVGNNKIEVAVSAKDGISIKKYEIIAHRRNEVEEIQNQEEQKVQVERLSAILEESQEKTEINSNNVPEENNFILIMILTVVGVIIVSILIYKLVKVK